MKDNQKYIMIPLEEYNEITSRLEKLDQEERDAIYYKRLFPKGYRRDWQDRHGKCLNGSNPNEGFIYLSEVSTRLFNCLCAMYEEKILNDGKFEFVGDLVMCSEMSILKHLNMGRKSVNELKNLLEKNGLYLNSHKIISERIKNNLDKLR